MIILNIKLLKQDYIRPNTFIRQYMPCYV